VLLWTYHLHFESQFASGLLLKKLDKKLERTLLHSYRKVILLSFIRKCQKNYGMG
jgi:hypothetical protein